MRQLILIIFLCSALFVQAQHKTQTDILKKYPSGNYTIYRNDQGKLDKVAKQWPVEVKYASNGAIDNVLVKRAGVVDETFVPDLKEAPGYFSYDNYKLMFFETYAAYYKQTLNSDGSARFEILYQIIPPDGSARNLKDIPQDITAYRAATLSNQSGARATITKNRVEAELKEREENALGGKNVKSLKIQPKEVPAKVGHLSTIEFGIVALLDNGKELKTKNIGGKTDFEYSYTIEAPGCTFADGVLKVELDASHFPNDEIVVTVRNIHNKAQSTQYKVPLSYDVPLAFNSNGESGFFGSSGTSGSMNNCNGQAGQTGKNGAGGLDYTIRATEKKHAKTGAMLYQVELMDSRNNVIHKLKVASGSPIVINTNGGKGGDGGTGGNRGVYESCKNNALVRGGNGGNGGVGGRGGNVSITKNSNAIPTAFFTVSNNGGDGGKAGEGRHGGSSGFAGTSGSRGSTNISVAPVKFSW